MNIYNKETGKYEITFLDGTKKGFDSLKGADLRNANLIDADLRGANLINANLRNADLIGANLRGANLRDANLRYANLIDAFLEDANLRDADLRGTNLRYADLEGAKGLHLFNILPEEGGFIGYKKVKEKCIWGHQTLILTLGIPKDALRCNAYSSRKCRTNKVKVLKIEDIVGNIINEKDLIMTGVTYSGIEYQLGKEIIEENYDADKRVECTNGIHFFITKQEAIDY